MPVRSCSLDLVESKCDEGLANNLGYELEELEGGPSEFIF